MQSQACPVCDRVPDGRFPRWLRTERVLSIEQALDELVLSGQVI